MPDPAGHIHDAAHTPAHSDGLIDFFRRLADADFVPRGVCVSWLPEVVWLHVFSDAVIALSYYSIPLALLYFVRRRTDIVYRWMFIMFAAFILACGTTHVLGVVLFWRPMYRLDGVIKLATAALSVGTAITLWPLIPKALLLPSPTQLRLANDQLAGEIVERRRAEEDLRESNATMEARVRERTAELAALNQNLKAEIEQRRRQERHMMFLLAELDHRVKNNLSMVLSLADESIRASTSLDQFSRAFTGRVQALARTHSALAAAHWEGVGLEDLVRAAVEALLIDSGGAERVLIAGEPVQLSSKAATAVVLILHELATNAAKYGAFSAPGGRVEVTWRRTDPPNPGSSGPWIRLEWSENNGPPVEPPARRGLGTQLIQEGASYELGGIARLDYRPTGLHCTLEFPLSPENTQRGRFESIHDTDAAT